MRRGWRTVAAGVLVALAAALVTGIVMLQGWGGRVEVALMVFGDPVWVTIDAGRSRILFLLLLPAALLGAALSLWVRRPGESPGE